MAFGLGSVRRRLHSLTRAVLVLFCAAWLQAAVVPCVMAHGGETATRPPEGAVQHAHDAQAGHDHAAVTGQAPAAHASHHCPYCPPDGSGGSSCDGHGGCAYPHEPQVDARAAAALFVAVPVSFVAASPGAQLLADRAEPAVTGPVPRVSFAVSYCRFLE